MEPPATTRLASIAQPDRADRPGDARGRASLVEQATTTVAHGIGEGIGAAKRLLSRPATGAMAPRSPTTLEPVKRTRPSKTPDEPLPGTTPTTSGSTKSCDVESYRWKNARVPLPDEPHKTVKLKNGSWDGSDEHACHWIELAEGPVFGDLNENGREESYLVIRQTIANVDVDGACSLGGGDISQVLLAYELDEACKPRPLGMIDDWQCEIGDVECKSFTLRTQGKHVVYGNKRFGWSGDSLQPTR